MCQPDTPRDGSDTDALQVSSRPPRRFAIDHDRPAAATMRRTRQSPNRRRRRSAPKRSPMRLSIISALFVVSACVDPSTSIATELGRYGLDATQAKCVGQRLESNLSIGQLRQLGRAAGALDAGDTTPGRLSGSDLLRAASQIQDPAVAVEVASAANQCGVAAALL